MKSSAIALLLAASAIVLSSDVTPAFASKMDGKCCQSSDGGRSWRYKKAKHDGARIPRTCSAYAATCFHYATEFSRGPDREGAMHEDRRLHRSLQRLAFHAHATNVAVPCTAGGVVKSGVLVL